MRQAWLFNQMICLCYAIRLSDTRRQRCYLLNLLPQLWNALCRWHSNVKHTLLIAQYFIGVQQNWDASIRCMNTLPPTMKEKSPAGDSVTWLKAEAYANSMPSWNVQHLHIKDDVIGAVWRCQGWGWDICLSVKQAFCPTDSGLPVRSCV